MNKFLILLVTGIYFVFADWFISTQVGHECASCVIPEDTLTTSQPKISIEGIEEFQLVPKIIDFSFNSAVPDTGYFFHVFLDYIRSVENEKTLIITGSYFDSEENSTNYENLGIARADAVKQLLLSKGIQESIIELASEKKSNIENVTELPNPSFSIEWVDNKVGDEHQAQLESIMSTVYPDSPSLSTNENPVEEEKNAGEEKEDVKLEKSETIDLEKTDSISKENSKVEKKSDKVILYFPFNSIKIKNYKEVDNYLSELAKELNDDKDLKVLLIGHTDDRGSIFANNRVAHRRAKIIRDILKKKGVSRSQIATESKGSTDPIAPNNSKANRNKNRRVEVIIIK